MSQTCLGLRPVFSMVNTFCARMKRIHFCDENCAHALCPENLKKKEKKIVTRKVADNIKRVH